MDSFIFEVAEYLWVLCILALLLSLTWPALKSARLTALIWVISNMIQDRIVPLLIALESTYAQVIWVIWYPCWMLLQIGTLALIWHIHHKFDWTVEKISQFLCLSLLMNSLLQFARFTDRVLLETNLLAEVYKFGIPAFNLAAIGAVLIWSVTGFIYAKRGIAKC